MATRQLETQQDIYLEAFRKRKASIHSEPTWLSELKSRAISRFSEVGFPTARRGNEPWKYTDIAALATARLRPLVPITDVSLATDDLVSLGLTRPGWDLLVLVNGYYCPGLSTLSDARGVTACSLAEGLLQREGLVQQHLARYADYQDIPFTALNTAFIGDGALVHIDDGASLPEPLHILHLTTEEGQESASYPRVLLVAGENSQASVIESYGSIANGRYFTNAVTEVALAQGASVRHYRLQQESLHAFHIHSTQVRLGRDSNYTSITLDLGGALTRNDLGVLLAEEGAFCTLNGVYITSGSQHVDNQVLVDHAKGYNTTRELYKGILGDRSRAVFHGSITVRQGAQKVDARQEDRNLLLSDQAEADTKPAFWIYADDVKCSHGAACGKLDELALFYLQTRSLGEEEARAILTRGFASEVIGTVPDESVRDYFDGLVEARLRRLTTGREQ